MTIERVEFSVEIEGGHAALIEGPRREIARILRTLADRLGDDGDGFTDPDDCGVLRDANGNSVGAWSLSLKARDITLWDLRIGDGNEGECHTATLALAKDQNAHDALEKIARTELERHAEDAPADWLDALTVDGDDAHAFAIMNEDPEGAPALNGGAWWSASLHRLTDEEAEDALADAVTLAAFTGDEADEREAI